jgi:MoaA/NifB/PqqE/SkfB family radical SAM enzyme
LDSSDPAEHDRFRGVSGTFKKTVQGINLALKRGFRVTLGTVVTHETLKSAGIHGLIAMARDLKLLFYFILPAPAGRWINNKSIFLTQEDIDYIQKLTRSSPYLRTDFQANLGGYGCGAVKEILYLTPYGDVLACPFLHISLGNIFEESIRKIRQRALENPYFAVYRDKCLVSTDAEFIDKYLKKTFNAGKLPLLWSEVFTLEAAE